tara:strand:+ start:443 stop:595 length:153 start_codon:yes stop_codon:yes gene_type:complete
MAVLMLAGELVCRDRHGKIVTKKMIAEVKSTEIERFTKEGKILVDVTPWW